MPWSLARPSRGFFVEEGQFENRWGGGWPQATLNDTVLIQARQKKKKVYDLEKSILDSSLLTFIFKYNMDYHHLYSF